MYKQIRTTIEQNYKNNLSIINNNAVKITEKIIKNLTTTNNNDIKKLRNYTEDIILKYIYATIIDIEKIPIPLSLDPEVNLVKDYIERLLLMEKVVKLLKYEFDIVPIQYEQKLLKEIDEYINSVKISKIYKLKHGTISLSVVILLLLVLQAYYIIPKETAKYVDELKKIPEVYDLFIKLKDIYKQYRQKYISYEVAFKNILKLFNISAVSIKFNRIVS